MFRATTPAHGRLAVVALTAAAAIAAGACRDVTAPNPDPATVTYAPALGIRIADFTKDTSGIYYRDVVVGSGLTAVPKSTVSYYYKGYLADGRLFDSSRTTTPSSAVVGNGDVIRGFDRGFLGMRQGGRRRILIPPALGYGNTSLRTLIPAGSILIFDVDAAGVAAPATTTTTTARARP